MPRTISFFLTLLIISMTCVLSLTHMVVFLSLQLMLSMLLSILVCAAESVFCACLVSVQIATPYVIAGSTHELYTCLFRQMEMSLLKISRCLAYGTQPAMILRRISLSWFLSLKSGNVVLAALIFKLVYALYGMYVICRRVLAPNSYLFSRLNSI